MAASTSLGWDTVRCATPHPGRARQRGEDARGHGRHAVEGGGPGGGRRDRREEVVALRGCPAGRGSRGAGFVFRHPRVALLHRASVRGARGNADVHNDCAWPCRDGQLTGGLRPLPSAPRQEDLRRGEQPAPRGRQTPAPSTRPRCALLALGGAGEAELFGALAGRRRQPGGGTGAAAGVGCERGPALSEAPAVARRSVARLEERSQRRFGGGGSRRSLVRAARPEPRQHATRQRHRPPGAAPAVGPPPRARARTRTAPPASGPRPRRRSASRRGRGRCRRACRAACPRSARRCGRAAPDRCRWGAAPRRR